jgi:hypothetical protein
MMVEVTDQNRTIRLWNRLPAEILGTLPCKPNACRKRVRKVINVVNCVAFAMAIAANCSLSFVY